jgi:hypothetical protein
VVCDGQGSQLGGSFGCIRPEVVVCLEETPHPTLGVAMMDCGTCRGCENVCVHMSPAEGTGIADHAVLVELGPSDHTEGRLIAEAPEGDLAFWIAMGPELYRLHSVLYSL